MPNSCKCILDKMLHKGAMTQKEHDKIARNLRGHASWEHDGESGEAYCSNCHRMTMDRHDEYIEYDGQKVIALCLPRYCGYCGAYMRQGEPNNE